MKYFKDYRVVHLATKRIHKVNYYLSASHIQEILRQLFTPKKQSKPWWVANANGCTGCSFTFPLNNKTVIKKGTPVLHFYGNAFVQLNAIVLDDSLSNDAFKGIMKGCVKCSSI